MTRLETVRRALARQVASPETRHQFAAARQRHPVLQPFCDPLAVVAFLNDTDIRASSARSAVTQALLAEVQISGTSCWSAILLFAFFPGLLRLRGSVRRAWMITPEELDMLVLESFLEMAATLPLETQGRLAVVNLMLGTRKIVFRQIRLAADRSKPECPLPPDIDELLVDEEASPEHQLLRGEVERVLTPERIRAWVRELYRDESEEDLLLVLGTYACGMPLITYVRQRWSNADADELLRHYQRCRRRRTRLLDRVRKRVSESGLSHSPYGPALLSMGAR